MKKTNILFPALANLDGRIATQPIRVFGFALYISILIVELLSWTLGWCGDGYGWNWLLIIGGTLGLFAVLELAEQRLFIRRPALVIAVAALAIRILLTEIAGVYSCTGFHTFFAFIPPVLAYLYIGQRAAYITAAVNLLLYINWVVGDGPMSWEYIQSENLPVEFFIILVGMIMMLVLGRTLVLEERNRERAEDLFEELRESQQQLTELAKVDERNRIARDIHDSVGHHIMAVTVQLEKAMAFRDINPQEADQALLDAKQSAQAALSDVRESVSTLRDNDSDFELAVALRQLVAGYGQLPVALHIEGNEAPHAKSALMALYRVAQEGLTNIEKYANATAVDLRVVLGADYLSLILTDDGVGFELAELEEKADSPDAHFGLLGLRERVELLGGTLSITSKQESGTTLAARIPTRKLA